ncbi:PHP domain-containing protein [Halovivax sp.]|uniref:PHP domain-containing protein n=1 Tax=Halovivax sp. TaxID=1935978 RepID=UPI0025BFE8C8|nr:PHP domain-containing protein [Halovivax sp.]
MSLRADYHIHSNYSDGRPLPSMLAAAAEAGLEAVGVTDHCNVAARGVPTERKRELGFNLDLTYERRREAVDSLRTGTDLTVYDAVELDYDARDEDAIADFLDGASFDYAIGSVHAVDDVEIFDRSELAALAEPELDRLVDRYYEAVVALVESELFDVVGHVDAIERTPELRNHTTSEHYELVADALDGSSTRPEINAGRALDEYGRFHPAPDFLAACRDRDVRFVPGTDAHRPDELLDRAPVLADHFADLGLEPAAPFR